MRRILQIITAAILSVAFIGSAAGAVQELQNCDVISINNTGTGSNNQVVCNVTVTANVTCLNNVYVLDANSQTAATGAASSQGNVTSGTAITGNATNENGQTVAIGASCGTTTTPTPVTPVTPGGGNTTPTSHKKPAVLPYTADTSAATIIAASIAAAAGIVAVSRLAVAAYRRYSVK